VAVQGKVQGQMSDKSSKSRLAGMFRLSTRPSQVEVITNNTKCKMLLANILHFAVISTTETIASARE
jgi:hypothetical protein